MKEDNLYNTDELEQMLGPQCEFHVSDSLGKKIVSAAKDMDVPKRKGFRRYAPWIASVACVAAVVGTVFLAYKREVAHESDGLLAKSVEMPDSSSSDAPMYVQENAGMPSNVVIKTTVDSRHSKTPNRKPETGNILSSSEDDMQKAESETDSYDFEIPDFPETEYVVYAVTSEEDAVLIPMTLVPEEIIRRQEESTREYLDYMRLEIESAQRSVPAHDGRPQTETDHVIITNQ